MSIMFLFFIVLLILKLTNVIDWPWWAITAPLWIMLLWYLLIITSCGFIFVLSLFAL